VNRLTRTPVVAQHSLCSPVRSNESGAWRSKTTSMPRPNDMGVFALAGAPPLVDPDPFGPPVHLGVDHAWCGRGWRDSTQPPDHFLH
jgi:hypothetical protein